jgi:DNA repair exonuclease SbcCD ATPase subunit
MSGETPLLRKGLFGYRQKEVVSFLAGREAMLQHAIRKFEATKAHAAGLESELSSAVTKLQEKESEVELLREENEDLNRLVERLRAEDQPQPRSEAAELTGSLVAQELGRLLTVAEGSAERIIEQARDLGEREVESAEQMWRQVEQERRRFATWRGELEPRIQSAQAQIAEAVKRVDSVSDRLQEVLAPVTSTMSSLLGELQELAKTSRPPLVVTPARPPQIAEPHAPSDARHAAGPRRTSSA